jgi:hypothetical protein
MNTIFGWRAITGRKIKRTQLSRGSKESLAKVGASEIPVLYWLMHSYANRLMKSGTDFNNCWGSASAKPQIYNHENSKNL